LDNLASYNQFINEGYITDKVHDFVNKTINNLSLSKSNKLKKELNDYKDLSLSEIKIKVENDLAKIDPYGEEIWDDSVPTPDKIGLDLFIVNRREVLKEKTRKILMKIFGAGYLMSMFTTFVYAFIIEFADRKDLTNEAQTFLFVSVISYAIYRLFNKTRNIL
jgi:hypothetical protein